MVYSIKLPDGVVVENIPDDVRPEDAKAKIIKQFPQYAPKDDQSIFRQFADVPLGLAKGATQGTRMLSNIFGAGTETSKSILSAENYIADLMSAQSKNDQQEIARIMKDAEDKGVLDQVVAGVKAFGVAPVDFLTTGLGTAIPAIATAGAASLLGAPAAVGTGITALLGAGMGAGTVKGAIYESTKQALVEAGANPEVAEQKAQQAQAYGGKNLDQILLGTVLGTVAGSGPLEKVGARILSSKILSNAATKESGEEAAKGAIRQRIESGLIEGVPEAFQGGQEQLAQNIALQREGMDVPTFRGVAGAATLEGLAGLGLGAAVKQVQSPELLEGQREGETYRQSAERLQGDILDLQRMREQQLEADQQAGIAGLAPDMQMGTPAPKLSIRDEAAAYSAAPQAVEEAVTAPTGIASVLEPPQAAPAEIPNEFAAAPLLPPQSLKPAQVATQPELGGIASILPPPMLQTISEVEPSLAALLTADQPSFEDSLNELIASGGAGKPAAPSILTNLTMPEASGATTQQQQQVQRIEDVGSPIGAGVPMAVQQGQGEPAAAGIATPEGSGVAAPLPSAARPAGGETALPAPVTPIEPESGVLADSPVLNTYQRNAVNTISELPQYAGTLQALNNDLQRLTSFINSQGASISGPIKTANPLVREAKFLYNGLLKTGRDYSVKAMMAQMAPTPEANNAVATLQKKIASNAEGSSKVNAFYQKIQQVAPVQPLPQPTEAVTAEDQAVEAEIEPDVIEQIDKQISGKTEQLGNILLKMMGKMGLRDVGLKIVSDLEAEGEYANQLIKLAIDAQSPVRALRHESIHALKELGFFSDKQWAVLKKEAETKWIKKFLQDVNVNQEPLSEGEQSRYDAYKDMFEKQGLSGQAAQEAMIEEAIADAFGDFDINGAPSGLMSAILKRMQNLFAAIRSSLGGDETAEQVLQRVEKGTLQGKPVEQAAKPKEPEEPKEPKEPEEPEEQTQPKPSLRRAAVPGETEISTQNPQGKTRLYDPIDQMLSIDQKAVEEAMELNPELYNSITSAILRYGFIPPDTKPEDVISLFKKNIVNNLLFLHDAVPADTRKRSKLWYDGANKIAIELGKQYDMTMEQVAGVLAAMSPQKDWFQNVSMGERAIDILTNQGDQSWDDNMLKYAESYIREPKDRKEREKRQIFFDKYIKRASQSKTLLKDMDFKTAAAFIRAFDEAYHTRQYRIVTPEGGFGDLVRNKDGKPSTMMWSTYGPIEKAVSIFRDRSRKNISEQLGAEHKIRSFYNNIAAPNADIDHVTIDTHAVAAALFEALAGTDQPVLENFGGTGKSSILGVGGTYGIIADAYREAAKARGIQAREMQSITWEAIRGLFTEELKSGIKPKVRAEWEKYRAGEQSFNEARDAIVEIASANRDEDWRNPDWINSGPGQTVAEGGASYDKDFEPEGGVRLREESELREKVTFNLSAVTSTIPGLQDLYQKAMSGDEGAYAALQKAAESSLKYLLSGTSAKVKVEYAKGVFLSDKEPALSVSAAFKEEDRKPVLAALERFASNYNQEQIHVRQPTAYKVGHQFDDNSYATPVYTIDLAKDLSNLDIDNVIDKSGLIAFTIAPLKTKTGTVNQLIAYWCKQNNQSQEEQSNDFDQFKSKVAIAQQLAGISGARPKQTVERLYAYGRGDTATHGYERIKGDVRPKQEADTETPRIIADYVRGGEGSVVQPKKLNKFQVASQQLLSDVQEALPINDLKKPIVRKAYNALNSELVKQFAVLPVKIEVVDTNKIKGTFYYEGTYKSGTPAKGEIVAKDSDEAIAELNKQAIDVEKLKQRPEPYANSREMRKDVSNNNVLKILKTQTGSFGPEGVPMADHPLLEQSEFKDQNNDPLLYNDLLRAVHDYYAHGVTPAEFGPMGEATAWQNHMATTMSPLARWAITAETRLQNAWQNFRPGAENIPLADRPYALQKAALPPVQFTLTGKADIDAPMLEFINTLTPKQQLGSLSEKSPLVKKIGPATTPKFSIRAPQTKEFKQWFGDSKIVDENGEPKVMYHGTARDITAFRTKQAGAIFVTGDPGFAETFADTSADWMTKNPQEIFSPEEIATAKRETIKSLQSQKKGLPKKTKDFFDTVIDYLKTDAPDADPMVVEYAREELKGQFREKLPTGRSIMPVFVKAESPFDYENPEHLSKIEPTFRANENGSLPRGAIQNGIWSVIESDGVQKAIRESGFDGFYVKENGVKNLAVYDPTQIKSATGNQGTFDAANPDIRKSLRSTLPAAVVQRIDQTTTAREDRGRIGRLLQAISPGSQTSIRAELLNRYNQLGVIDKMRIKQMGGAAAMADVSAESAALLSDLRAGIVASALGVHDKVGGAPVYVQRFYVVRNGQILPRKYRTKALAQAAAGANGEVRSGGHTAVVNFSGNVKGPLAIFAPLAARNDPLIYQAYQFWSAAKRGRRLTQEGRETLLTPADQAHANFLEKQFPEFVSVQKEWNKYNNKLVDYMVDTGVLSPEKRALYTMYADYVPFYRQMEGQTTAGPKIFSSISGVKPPKELKGADRPLDDFLENVVRNTQAAVEAGLKNVAAQRAVEAAQDVGLAAQIPINNGMPTTITVHKNGVPTHYACSDVLFINAMKSLGMSDIPFLSLLSMPANLLRAAVTREPTFMLANMLRDSLSSYVTSGVNMTPIVDTAKNFAKAIVGASPEYDALRKAGIVGGYDFASTVEESGRLLGEQLKEAAGIKSKGLKRAGELVVSPVTGIWQALEKGSEASDAATRIEIYKRTLAETGNETEALFKSLEVMNFNRKGRNPGVRVLTAIIPFLNARMQGLDILYRTAIQPSMPGQTVAAREKELQHKFFVRGATMAALSCLYWALTHDDDEYKKQEQENKDNYWLLPSLGIKIPIPFEVGVLFKVIPERIMALSFGDDSFEDFRTSMLGQLVSTLQINLPQAVVPIIENVTNHSFYTGRPIVSQGLEGLEPGYQVGPSTSTIMADFGKATGLSPIKLEHAIQGYTGQMGMYLVSVLDAMYDANSTIERPAKRFEQLPLIKRFAIDPEARGSVTAFYKLKDQVDAAVKTANTLERSDPDAYEAYLEENIDLLTSKEYINVLAKQMNDLANFKKLIRTSDDSAEEKRAALLEVQQLENGLTENIFEFKRGLNL